MLGLESGEHLIGGGEALVVDGITLGSAGSRPTLSASSGTAGPFSSRRYCRGSAEMALSGRWPPRKKPVPRRNLGLVRE